MFPLSGQCSDRLPGPLLPKLCMHLVFMFKEFVLTFQTFYAVSVEKKEITHDNFIPRINHGFTSHILFHVLYKDINNGQNYKNHCAGSPSLCT